MIAWFALGLGVVIAAALVVREGRERRTVTVPPQPEATRERPELNEEQKRDLSVVWSMVVCGFCGNVHGGICPRVREIRYHPSGTFERVIFWPERRWHEAEGTISAWDVYGLAVPNPPQGVGNLAEAARTGATT
jgi:hypothetical protein